MDEAALRRTLTEMLRASGAHLGLKDALKGLRPEWRTHRPPGLHSIWQLVEHMRITQEDILCYTLEPGWTSPEWPKGYWPENPSDLPEARWQETLMGFRRDLERVIALVQDPTLDLTAPLPHGEGRTYLRQVLLVADHNAYHTGQVVDIRRLLGDWPGEASGE